MSAWHGMIWCFLLGFLMIISSIDSFPPLPPLSPAKKSLLSFPIAWPFARARAYLSPCFFPSEGEGGTKRKGKKSPGGDVKRKERKRIEQKSKKKKRTEESKKRTEEKGGGMKKETIGETIREKLV